MEQQPNVVIITSHDTGRHIGCYGHETVSTPHLDKLATEGCRFTNYYATSALCSPSRGAMMTGRYPQRNGMMGLCHAPSWWSLNPGEKHLSKLMHDGGYYTALIGHQHETEDIDRDFCVDYHGYHREEGSYEHLSGDKVATGVERFLDEKKWEGKPLFLQIGFFETHRPYSFGGATPEASKGIAIPEHIIESDEAQRDFAAFQGNLKNMDLAVGRILETIDCNGLRDNTIVVYSTDHGLAVARAKSTLYDPGIGIALLMRYPEVIKENSECHSLLHNVDLVPTLLEMTGIASSVAFDGKSFTSLFNGCQGAIHHTIYAMQTSHGENNEIRCARTAKYKLIRNFYQAREIPVPTPFGEHNRRVFKGAKRCPFVELYDLENDPMESANLAYNPDYKGICTTLDAQLLAWMKEVDDPIVKGPVATPYYKKAIADLVE